MKSSKKLTYIALTGLAYYLLVRFTEFSLACPFYYLTGYKCPGCGITTMVLALLDRDWQAAKQANTFLFYTLPILAISIMVYQANSMVVVKNSRIYKGFICIYAIALILFGLYRNINN